MFYPNLMGFFSNQFTQFVISVSTFFLGDVKYVFAPHV